MSRSFAKWLLQKNFEKIENITSLRGYREVKVINKVRNVTRKREEKDVRRERKQGKESERISSFAAKGSM